MSLPLPQLQVVDGRCFAALTAPYRLVLPELQIDHTVPTSFRCFDGASLPRWARPLLDVRPFDAEVQVASLVHDQLYQVPAARHARGLNGWGRRRRPVDELFWELLLRGGLAPAKAWIMFKAVRAGGKPAWQRPQDGPRACDPDATAPCPRPRRSVGGRRALVALLDPPGALKQHLEHDLVELRGAGLGRSAAPPRAAEVAELLRAAARLPDDPEDPGGLA